MYSSGRLSPLARALRIFSAAGFCMFIMTMVIVSCTRDFNRRHKRRPDALSISRIAFAETAGLRASRRALRSIDAQEEKGGKHTQPVNVETTNLTVVLEHVEVDSGNNSAHWMYTNSSSPFQQHANGWGGVYANPRFTWNDDGRGNGSCSSGGSGKVSRGYLDPYNYFLSLETRPDFSDTTVELRNLSLADFLHINTVRPSGSWNVMGESGDTRRYNHGTFRILSGDKVLLSSRNVQWVQNLSYPNPVGEAQDGTLSLGAYFVAELQEVKSDKDWVQRLDPNGVGFVLGIITAASVGPEACFSSNSYWISLRGFPDFSHDHSGETTAGFIAGGQKAGAKVGNYKGSSDRALSAARSLSNTAKGVVITVVTAGVGVAVTSTAISVVAPGATSGPPGQGLVRLLGTVAFVAKVNEIYGFHSGAMSEFAGGLKMFIGKIDWPWVDNSTASSEVSRLLEQANTTGHQLLQNSVRLAVDVTVRQENEETVTITEELFGNCAFYTTLIVVGFLLLHLCIWLATRKKPLHEQLVPHAWMIYLFSVIMSHIFRAAVLSSVQYMRSHLGAGTGKAGLYVVAVLQLLIIGVGFTAFFVTIMVMALKRVRNQDVQWIPRDNIADPEARRSAFIIGEYNAQEGKAFHSLFECYYSSLAGPRLWLAALELTIVFLDAICTAAVWNEVACLAILVCVYAFLFALFLLLSPFVDKVEGWLVIILGLVELVLLILDFLAALGDYDMAESMEFGALVLGFVAIALAVIIAIYCDLIPIVISLWQAMMRRWRGEVIAVGKEGGESSDLESEWSGISGPGSETILADRNMTIARDSDVDEGEPIGLEALVAYNAAKEKEVREQLSPLFENAGSKEEMTEENTGRAVKGQGRLEDGELTVGSDSGSRRESICEIHPAQPGFGGSEKRHGQDK